MDIVLSIDSTLPGLAVSLADQERILWKTVHPEQTQQTQLLTSHIAEGLKANNKKLEDVTAVIVATGPGSFTGIKVSLAFVYGLIETGISRRATLGVSSLELLAQDYAEQFSSPVALCLRSTRTAGYLCLASDVRPAKTFVLQVQDDTKLLYSETEMLAANVAELNETLSHFRVLTVGAWPEAAQAIKPDVLEVKVEQALDLGLDLMHTEFKRLWPQGFSAEIPQPRYLRPSSPEEKLLLSRLQPSL